MINQGYYKNKNILIIGGSFGIGEELCKNLAESGANLAIAARSIDKIESLCSDLPGNHFSMSCDVTKVSDLKKISSQLNEKWEIIDLIIFCAGSYCPMNLSNFNLAKSKEIININLISIFNFIDAFLPLFKKNKIPHLAVISSVAGYFGMPNSLAYGASKAALSNLMESLYYELRQYKTKVQLINPGFVKTRLTDQNGFKMPGIISPKQAASLITKKMRKGCFEIAFPFIFTFTMKLLSILPYKVRFFLFKNLK